MRERPAGRSSRPQARYGSAPEPMGSPLADLRDAVLCVVLGIGGLVCDCARRAFRRFVRVAGQCAGDRFQIRVCVNPYHAANIR